MGNQKTSVKHRRSSLSAKKTPVRRKSQLYYPEDALLDRDLVAKGVWECLCDNDPDGAMEIIETHLWAKNKVKKARECGLAKTTLYHAFKSRNPTLSTLAKMLHGA